MIAYFSRLRPTARTVMVASGYAVAFAIAALVLCASIAATNTPDRQTYAGMSAFGDNLVSRPDSTHTRLAPECVRSRDRLLRGRSARVVAFDALGAAAGAQAGCHSERRPKAAGALWAHEESWRAGRGPPDDVAVRAVG